MNNHRAFAGKTVPILLLAAMILTASYFLLQSEMGGLNEGAGRLSVITRFYGVTAEEIEKSVTIPLEDAISDLPGIAEFRSYSEFSLSRIDLRLNSETDIDEFMIEARERIERGYAYISQLNPAVQKPQIVRSGSDQQAIFIVAFSGKDMEPEELRPLVENEIKPSYSRIGGLGEIEISGGSLPEIHVDVDTDKAAAIGYSSDSVASIIRGANIFSPAGMLDSENRSIPVSLEGRIKSLEALRNLPIGSGVKLNDIARAYFSSREAENISRLNGSGRVSLHIKSSAGNIIAISRLLRDETDHWRALGWDAQIVYDRGLELEQSFRRVAAALLTGMLLSSLILFLFSVGVYRVLALLCIQPLILLLSLGLLAALGFSPDRWLLAGLTIGIGMILDSALLVTGALESCSSDHTHLARPLISSTLSTLAALLPVLSVTGELPGLKPLLAALSTMLAISLFISLIFINPFYNRGRRKPNGAYFRLIMRQRKKLLGISKRICSAAVNGRRAGIIAPAILLPLSGLLCLLSLNIRLDLPADSPVVFARVELKEGESLDSADKKISGLCRLIESHDSIESLQSISRRGGGSLTVRFDDDKTSRDDVITILKASGSIIPGGFLYIPEDDSSDILKLTISVIGPEVAMLKTLSREALSVILQNDWAVEGVLHFKEDPPAYHYIPDRDALAAAGLSALNTAAFLRWNLQGPVADKWYFSGRERDLRVMADGSGKLSVSALGALKLPGKDAGSFERLDQLGRFVRTTDSSRLNRLNRQHSESFTIGCRSSDPVELNSLIWQQLNTLDLPEGYSFIPTSRLIEKQRLYKRLWLRFILAVVLIFFLLSIERESLRQAGIILLQLLLILPPPLIVIRLIGMQLGTETILGLILISGMGINNGILIMDNLESGVFQAVKIRFNGLFLTTVTSIGGLIPMLFTAAPFFVNLAIVLISGLAASFAVSILIFPVFIAIMCQHPC